MPPLPRRQKGNYFPPLPDAPAPIAVRLHHRIRFSDVDPMGILWHGRYAHLFELANEELGRVVAMSYPDFKRERIAAPIVQFHVDYFAPLTLAEVATTIGKMVWSEGARLNIEYEVRKESGALAATGYTVQMFVDETGGPLLASPALLESCRRRWLAGDFSNFQ
jgi:acyl-CoA thioester hydrolase